MRQTFENFCRLYDRLLTVIAILAGLAFFIMMWLIDVNAISRKLLNAPVTGTLEITEAAMVFAVLLPMAYTQMTRGHIRVTLLTKHLSLPVRRALYTAGLFIGFLFAAWSAWATFGFFMRSWAIDEHAWGTIRFPIYPSKGAVALGLALLSIQFLLDTIRVGIFGGSTDEDHEDIDDESAFGREAEAGNE